MVLPLDSPNLFLCKLWKITRKPQPSVINTSRSEDSAFVPQLPVSVITSGLQSATSFYRFGTAISQSENGDYAHNQSCGQTVYWRTLSPTTSTTIRRAGYARDDDSNISYWYYSRSNIIRLIIITQQQYDDKFLGALPTSRDFHLLYSADNDCRQVNRRTYAETPMPTDLVYANAERRNAIATANDRYPSLSISFFKFGQGKGVNYNVRCEWSQTTGNGVFTRGVTYQSDRLGSFTGKITNIAIYVENRQYYFEVDHSGGTTVVPITYNGDPLYAIPDDTFNSAVAGSGIRRIQCLRVDDAVDNDGDRSNQTVELIDTIIPLGFTDFDSPLEYDGVLYEPYYGGSGSDFVTSTTGDPGTGMLELAFQSGKIQPKEVLAGLYYDAQIECLTYDWANDEVFQRNYIGYLGKSKIDDSRDGAYKFQIEINSVLTKLQQKEYNIITTKCPLVFGSQECGVNLVPSGLVDDVNVVSVDNSVTITIGSSRPDNYYERIEYVNDGIVYSFEVADYNSATSQLRLWADISLSGLSATQIIKAIARCNRTSDDCKKFQGTKLNYGGFDRIPSENSLTAFRD